MSLISLSSLPIIPKKKNTKYLFVSGGVISGIGKGIATSSIGLLLKAAGYKVSILKADMYLNVDAGTMNPLEHGEVFVTEDGVETDQDLGHYERFLNQNLSRHNYFTLGQVYWEVLNKERQLGFEGKCVEGHIHIPEHIITKILEVAKKDKAEIMLIEVGGTVGEYQNVMFYEAIRRLKQRYPGDVFLAHLVYLIVPKFLGEMKTKPAQASIYDLYKLGIHPDFVICRSNEGVDDKRKKTISFNTGIPEDHLIAAPDTDNIYKIPLIFKEQGLELKIQDVMGLSRRSADTKAWEEVVKKAETATKEVKIAITGKYFTSGKFSLEDSYVCVIEAIKHAAWSQNLKPVIKWFDVAQFEDPTKIKSLTAELKKYDGVIVPQGWGSRGVEGKIKVVEIARKNKIPYLGLCFGMQMAVIEYARNVLKLKDASSEEANPNTKNPVIHMMAHQKEYLAKHQYGGTIRLGAWPCQLTPRSILKNSYEKNAKASIKDNIVLERHRHRYEVNNSYRRQLEEAGLIISGTSPDKKLVEVVELPKSVHPFFVGTQFHPEYKSRPLNPHPLFIEFIKACGQ